MIFRSALLLLFVLVFVPLAKAQPAVVSTIRVEDLAEFDKQPESVQKLIRSSLSLTSKNLAYTFGSNTPKKGGMDCSGAIQYAIQQQGVQDVPRMCHTFYLWLEKHGKLKKISNVHSPEHSSLNQLKPGDLLFWEGTYNVGSRQPPISHVMLYLGTLKADGKGVLFGSSSGRRFRGKKIHGVSVFDMKVPNEQSKASLVGYGSIPGMRPKPPAPKPVQSQSQTNKPKLQPLKPIKGLMKALSKKSAN